MSRRGNDPVAFDAGELRAIARRAATRAVGASGAPEGGASAPLGGAGVDLQPIDRAGDGTRIGSNVPREGEERELVGESIVHAAPPGSELVVPPHARVTPLARELAFQKGVKFVSGRSAEPLGPIGGPIGAGATGARRSVRIAVASDHGGFALKDQIVPLLREMGERPIDLGPQTADVSVDYPDFARSVAVEVSEGRASIGIVIDGAGIGSAMVANKVPGVLAANCWNEASARNAREHNHANVLTLGSGHLDLAAARAVVAAFLSTPVGDGRHARRAGKTIAVEGDYLRARHLARTFDESR